MTGLTGTARPRVNSEPVSVAMAVAETLRDLGVRHVFGVPSGGWVDYMEALRQTDGIDFVLASHEGGAAFMAAVSGHLSGAPGVCFGTFGPGATNLATGVGCALLDRMPLIALTDEMPAAWRGRTVQMGIDHQALFRPLTKATTRLTAGTARQAISDAARLALAERPGPVHIGLPVGLSAETTTAGLSPLPPVAVGSPSKARLVQAAQWLQEARKPLLAVGLSAARAGLGAQLTALAEQLQAPIVLTPMAKGLIDEAHPLYAGVLFHALSDVVAETYRQSDCVLAVGYDPVEFNYESWLPPVRLISLDTEPVDIDANIAAEVCDVVGDLAASLAGLAGVTAIVDWDLQALHQRRQQMRGRLRGRSDVFGPCAALDLLRAHLPQDGIMSCDVGAHTHLIGQHWSTPAWGLQLMSNGWSSMGFGLPAAIAAKLTRPEQAVCAVVGDGGFLMSAGELAVAVRLQLKITVVLFTDNDLALIRIKQQKKANPIYGTPIRAQGAIGGPSLFGVPVLTAATRDTFAAALREADTLVGPVIVEALLDSREYDELVLRANR